MNRGTAPKNKKHNGRTGTNISGFPFAMASKNDCRASRNQRLFARHGKLKLLNFLWLNNNKYIKVLPHF